MIEGKRYKKETEVRIKPDLVKKKRWAISEKTKVMVKNLE